ncbi:MAG: WD40-repeat-containing domain protein [Lentinula lateritia]|uniref:WD40-repeat-containing domain protein n=1 Tax=Lentinula lateritia TaxID=40482 RepID=A0ABQ8VT81_9AGAR|nr:MAG: WD40-repeat-containing domain protein [Lentinula lateritia]KAJ4499581.1 WD40-repeat-containing domain protein [Lentinula lateritia]
MSQAAQPWYEDLQHPHPFIFRTRIRLRARIRCIVPFPELWSNYSAMTTVWSNTKLFDSELAQRLDSLALDQTKWKQMIDHFKETLVVAEEQTLYIIWPSGSARSIQIELDQLSKTKLVPTDKVNVAWALSPDKPYEPFVLFSYSKLVYIFNVHKKVIEGCLRGHGGEITSIAVHPRAAHIFCTTSRDFTSRLYDLTRRPQLKPNNPPWPPSLQPSLAGAAHGLDMSFEEGNGIGRCVLILMGGRSGGHQAEVFGAAFHDSYPIIATCGMDRTIKIWHISYFSDRSEQKLLREDKPLFSSSMIHKARVLSVNWLTSDVLLTHSAPARMLVIANPPVSTEWQGSTQSSDSSSRQYDQDEPGSLTLWKWLSIKRFFPLGWDKAASRQQVLRGFGSDYQESASFRTLSSHFFPSQTSQYITPSLYFSRGSEVPFVVYSYPNTRHLNIVNIKLFEPLLPSTSPPDEGNKSIYPVQNRQIQGWEIALGSMSYTDETLETCIMISGGKMIVAGGSKGSLWFLTVRSS